MPKTIKNLCFLVRLENFSFQNLGTGGFLNFLEGVCGLGILEFGFSFQRPVKKRDFLISILLPIFSIFVPSILKKLDLYLKKWKFWWKFFFSTTVKCRRAELAFFDEKLKFLFYNKMPVPQGRIGVQGPSCFDRVKLGFMMGACVGMASGFMLGGFSAWRTGLRGREFFHTVGKIMLQGGGTFGVFMGIGSAIRCWWKIFLDFISLFFLFIEKKFEQNSYNS